MFRSLYKVASKAATSLEHSLDTVLSNGPESYGAFVNADVRIGDKTVRLGRVVAEGGYSFIHIARLSSGQNNNACYAVKRVALSDEEGRAAAEREVRVLDLIEQGLNNGDGHGHEHIVRYYGSSEWKGHMFFLFDFIDGGTLHERLPAIHQRHNQQQRPQPTPLHQHHHHHHHHHQHRQLGSARDGRRHEDATASSSSSTASVVACEILDIFEQIVSAIAHLHACSPDPICVMDIKLENVLYDRLAKSYKLIDFGSATTQTYPTRTMSRDAILTLQDYVNGHCTTMYCAPEAVDVQAARGAVVCERVDVWALGCLWYAMMFNELPFDGASVLAITTGLTVGQRKMMDEQAEKLGYPKGFTEVVKSCLVDDPIDRADVFAVLTAVRRMQIGIRTERGVERMRKMGSVTTITSKSLMLERHLEESGKRVRRRRNKEFGSESKRVDIEVHMDINMDTDMSVNEMSKEERTRKTIPHRGPAVRAACADSHGAQSNGQAQTHYSGKGRHGHAMGVHQQQQEQYESGGVLDITNNGVDDDDEEWGEFTQNTGSNHNMGSSSLIDFSDLTTTKTKTHVAKGAGMESRRERQEQRSRNGAHVDDETDFVKLFQMTMP